MTSKHLRTHRAEHSLCCEVEGALISLGLICLWTRWETELDLVIGLQLQICAVEWFCLVLGILSSLLRVYDVHN